MDQNNHFCAQIAAMLGGTGQQDGVVCMVMRPRKGLSVLIADKPLHTVGHMFHFEAPDREGNSLITGEIVLLENEVFGTVKSLTEAGIIVSALHSHWLFDHPKLMYIHLETNMCPAAFAAAVRPILDRLHP